LVFFGFLGIERFGLGIKTLLESMSILGLAVIWSVPRLGGDEFAVIAFREDRAVVAQGCF
jgi:hypothetical protein